MQRELAVSCGVGYTSVTENGVNSNILELVMNDGNEKAVLCGNDCKGDKYNGKKQYV